MTVKDILMDIAESRPVSKGSKRDTGLKKGTGLGSYDTGRAKELYSLAREMGVTGAYKSPELDRKGLDAYRAGSDIIFSDSACRYELPDGDKGLRAAAYYASKDPGLAARLLHEIFEEGAPSRVGSREEDDRIHADIHARAYIAARNMGYEEAADEVRRIGSGFTWGQLSYDKIDEKLFGGPSLALYKSGYERAAGQPQLPSGILTAPGRWMEMLVDLSKSAAIEWRNPESDPVYGPASIFTNVMKAAGHGMAPVSKLVPNVFTYTLGPRRERP